MSQRSVRTIFLAMFVTLALTTSGGLTADDLATAVKARDSARVSRLLKSGAQSSEHSSYASLLHIAASLGPPEVVIALLDAGADPQARGFGGASPLHTAVLAGQSAIVRALIEWGAEVDALDNHGRTPLLTFASGSTQNLEVLRILLKAGANPNLAEVTTEFSALNYAAMQGRVDMAELLVMAGASVNAKDALYGQTPLHFATNCGYPIKSSPEMVQFLISHGVDVNAKDSSGFTALNYVQKCAPNGNLMRKILDKAGAK
jgi:ankyrin repeat protein